MAPRGRPRKKPIDEVVFVEEKKLNKPEEIISDYLARHCDIPGCLPKWHLDDANMLINLLRQHDYILKRGN